MKKFIATLVIAGMGVGLTAGAQAQTVTGTSGIYTLSVSLAPVTPITTALPVLPPGIAAYQYDYTVKLATIGSGAPSSLNIIDVNFGGVQDYLPGSNAVVSQSAGMTYLPATEATPSFSAGSAGTGFKNVGDTAVFQFDSTLPPNGTVNISSNANPSPPPGTNYAGVGSDTGPGPAVPEAGSFGLIGLGLLPLGLMARRRINKRA